MSQCFFNASSSSAFVGQDSEPQTAPAVNTASTWEMLWGAAGTRPHPYRSLKLQSFKTVSSAKEVLCLQLGHRSFPATRLPRVRRAASEQAALNYG